MHVARRRCAGGMCIIIALYTRDLDVSVSADVIFLPPEFHINQSAECIRVLGSSSGEIACVRKVPMMYNIIPAAILGSPYIVYKMFWKKIK